VLPAGAQSPVPVIDCGKLPHGSARHGTAIVAGRMYFFGGIGKAGWSETIFSAPITPEGKVGMWRKELLLPDRRAMLENSVVVSGRNIYLVGRGKNVLCTKVGDDGFLTAWARSPEFNTAQVSYGAARLFNGRFYIIGGKTEATQSIVQIGDLAGMLRIPSGWRSAPSLPKALWFHSIAVVGERMFVWGGLTGGAESTNDCVFSAAISATDGSVGEWRRRLKLAALLFPWQEDTGTDIPPMQSGSEK
jgi:hypothetical protein